MPKERKKVLCMDAQRHAEYYGVQQTFDELYAKSKAGEVFNGLMELVLSPDNIMLAYRNIKTNTGSYTAGTDKQNIGDIGRLPPAEVIGKVRKIVTGSEHGYHPKPVRRKDIPKPNGKTRPLGIPCIWDRLVQQCIKQILEPICEAKFSNLVRAYPSCHNGKQRMARHGPELLEISAGAGLPSLFNHGCCRYLCGADTEHCFRF